MGTHGLQYLRKPYNSDVYADITDLVSGGHVSGTETLNNLPLQFNFETISRRKKGDSHTDLNIGDHIVVTENTSYKKVIAAGRINNPGRTPKRWLTDDDRYLYSYRPACQDEDFSDRKIDSLVYTQDNLTTILNGLFSYSNETIGSTTIAPYVLNGVTDYQIDSFSVTKKTLRAALTDLCKQTGLFWRVKYYVEPDATNLIKFTRQIEIIPAGGVGSSDPAWAQGIQDDHVRTGKYFDAENSKKLPGEFELLDSVDTSEMITHLDLSGNIYADNDDTTLSYWITSTKFDTLEYTSPYKAGSIECVGLLIETRVLEGSDTTTVRVPSRQAEDMATGDRVVFWYRDKYDLYTIATKNYVDTTYTELTFSEGTLGFSPLTNGAFYRVGNVPVYDDNQETDETTGVNIDLNLSNPGFKLRFLKYSEPPEGQKIITYFSKIQPYKLETENDPGPYEYKYKNIQLPDDVILTRNEFDLLAYELMQPIEIKTLTVRTRRQDLAKIGMKLPVAVTEYHTDLFILQKNSFASVAGRNDRYKRPMFKQTLTFTNKVTSVDQILAGLTRKRSAQTTSETKKKRNFPETIRVQDELDFLKVQGEEYILFDSDKDGTRKIYAVGSGGGKPIRLTNPTGGDYDFKPMLSNDGSQIIFTRYVSASGVFQVYTMDYDGGNVTNVSNDLTNNERNGTWTSDGKIIYEKWLSETVLGYNVSRYRLWIMDSDGSNDTLHRDNLYTWIYDPIGTVHPFKNWGSYTLCCEYHNNGNHDNPEAVLDNSGSYAHRSTGYLYPTAPGGPWTYLIKNATYRRDGNKIVFTRDGNVWIMDDNGASPTQLTSESDTDHEPFYDLADENIYFCRNTSGQYYLKKYNISGATTSDINVTDHGSADIRNPFPCLYPSEGVTGV